MTARAPRQLPPPTAEERARARVAAQALLDAIAEPSIMGERSRMHLDFSHPRRVEWRDTWANLPGFYRVNGRFRHDCLPGWEYSRAEVRSEMIADLEALAEHGVRPTETTSSAEGALA